MVLRSNQAIPDVIQEVAARKHESPAFLRLDMAASLFRRNPLDQTDGRAAALAIGYIVIDALYCAMKERRLIGHTVSTFDSTLLACPHTDAPTVAGHLASRIQRLLYKSVAHKIEDDTITNSDLQSLSERADDSWRIVFANLGIGNEVALLAPC